MKNKTMLTCSYCNVEFPKGSNTRQKYCSKECYKNMLKDERDKKSLIKKMEPVEPKYPSFSCEKCGGIASIDFDIKMEKKRWEEFTCPHCKSAR